MYYTTVADVVSIPSSSSLMLSEEQSQFKSQTKTRGGPLTLAASSSAFPSTPEAALGGGGDQQQISSGPVATLSSTHNGTTVSIDTSSCSSPNAEYFRQRRRELELEYFAALESTVPPPPAQGPSGGGRGGASKSSTAAATTAASNSNNKGADGGVSSPTNHKGGLSDSDKSGGLQAEMIPSSSVSLFQNQQQQPQHQVSLPHPQLVNANHPRNATITKAFKQKLALLEEEERMDMRVWGRKTVDTGLIGATFTATSSATKAAATNSPAGNKGNTSGTTGGTTINNNNIITNSSSTSTHQTLLMSRQLPPPPSASEIIKETLVAKLQSLFSSSTTTSANTTNANKTNTNLNLSPLGGSSATATTDQQQRRTEGEGPHVSSSSDEQQHLMSSIERVISDGIATDPILRGAFDSFEKVLGIIEDFVGAGDSLRQQQQQQQLKQQQTNHQALGFVGVPSAEAEQLVVFDGERGGADSSLTSLGKFETALLPSSSAGSPLSGSGGEKQQQTHQRRRLYILRNLFLSLSTERRFLIGSDEYKKEGDDTGEKGGHRAFDDKREERSTDGGADVEEAEAIRFMGLVLCTALPSKDDDYYDNKNTLIINAASNTVGAVVGSGGGGAATRSDTTTNTTSSSFTNPPPSSSSGHHLLPKSPDSMPLPQPSLPLPPRYISALVLTYKRLRALVAEYLVLYFSNRVVSLSLDDSYGPSCGLCEGSEVWQRSSGIGGGGGGNNPREGGGGGLCVCGISALMSRRKEGPDGGGGGCISGISDDDDSDTNDEPSYYYNQQQQQTSSYHQKTQAKQGVIGSSNGPGSAVANTNNNSNTKTRGAAETAHKSSTQLSSSSAQLPSARVLNLIRPPTPLFASPSMQAETQYKGGGQADEFSQRPPPRRWRRKTFLPAAPLFTLSGVVSSGVTVTVGCVVIPHVDSTQSISRPTGPHRQVREAFLRFSGGGTHTPSASASSGGVAGNKSAAKSTPLASPMPPTATTNNAAEDTNTTGGATTTTNSSSTQQGPLVPSLSPTSSNATAEAKEKSHGHDQHQQNLHSLKASLHQSTLHSTVFPMPYVTGGKPELLRFQIEGDMLEKAQLAAKIKATEATIGKTNAFREFRESQRQKTSHNRRVTNNNNKNSINTNKKRTTPNGEEENKEGPELSGLDNSAEGTDESTSYSDNNTSSSSDEDNEADVEDERGRGGANNNNKTTTASAAAVGSSPSSPQGSGGGAAAGRTQDGEQQIQQAGASQPPATANNANKDKSAPSNQPQQQQQSTAASPTPNSSVVPPPVSAAALLQMLSESSSSTSVGTSFSSATTTAAAAKEQQKGSSSAKGGGPLSSAPDGEGGSSSPIFSSSLSSLYPSPQTLFEQFSAALRENAPDLLARNFYESALLRLPIAATTQPVVDALIAKAANKWILAGKALDQVVLESLRDTGLFVLATAARYVLPSQVVFISIVKAMLSMVTSTLLFVAPRDGGIGYELLWQNIEQLLFCCSEDETMTGTRSIGNKNCWTPPPSSVASGAPAVAGGAHTSPKVSGGGGSASQQQQQQQQQILEPLALAAMAEKLIMIDQVLSSIGGLSVTVGGEGGEAVGAESVSGGIGGNGGCGKLLPPMIAEPLAAIIQQIGQQNQNSPSPTTTNTSNNASSSGGATRSIPSVLESLSDEGLANLSPATISSFVVMCTGALISLLLFLKYEREGGMVPKKTIAQSDYIMYNDANTTKPSSLQKDEKGGFIDDKSQQQQQQKHQLMLKMAIPLSIPSCVPNRTLVRRLSLMLSCWTAKAKTLGCRHDTGSSSDRIVVAAANATTPTTASSSRSSPPTPNSSLPFLSRPLELYEGFSAIFSGDDALSPLAATAAARSGGGSRSNGGGPHSVETLFKKNMVGKPFRLPTPMVRYDTDLWQVLNSSAYSEAIEQASKRNGLGEYAMQEGASSSIVNVSGERRRKNTNNTNSNNNNSSGGGDRGEGTVPAAEHKQTSYALLGGARAAPNNRTAPTLPLPKSMNSSNGYNTQRQRQQRITLRTPSGVPLPITLVPKGLEMMSAASFSTLQGGGGGGSCRSLAACFEALSIADSALRSAAGLPIGRYSSGGKGGGSYPPWELYNPHHGSAAANGSSGDTNNKGGGKKVAHSSTSMVVAGGSSSSSSSSSGVRTLSQCLAGGLRAVRGICSQIDLDEEDSNTVEETTNRLDDTNDNSSRSDNNNNNNTNNTNTTIWYRCEGKDEDDDKTTETVGEGCKRRFDALLRKVISTLQQQQRSSSSPLLTSVTVVFAIGLDGAGYPTLTHFVQELAKIRRVAAALSSASSSGTAVPPSHRLKIVFDLRDIIAHAPMIPVEVLSNRARVHATGGGTLMPLLRVVSPQTVVDLAVGGGAGAGAGTRGPPYTSSSVFSPTAIPQFLQAVAKKRKQLVASLAARGGGMPTSTLQAEGSHVGNNTAEGCEDQPQGANAISAHEDTQSSNNGGSKEGTLGVGVGGTHSLATEGAKQCTTTLSAPPQQITIPTTTTTYLAADISSSTVATAATGSQSHSSSSSSDRCSPASFSSSSSSQQQQQQYQYQSAACFWLHFAMWCDVDGIILPPCRGGHVSSVYNEMLRIEERLFS